MCSINFWSPNTHSGEYNRNFSELLCMRMKCNLQTICIFALLNFWERFVQTYTSFLIYLFTYLLFVLFSYLFVNIRSLITLLFIFLKCLLWLIDSLRPVYMSLLFRCFACYWSVFWSNLCGWVHWRCIIPILATIYTRLVMHWKLLFNFEISWEKLSLHLCDVTV